MAVTAKQVHDAARRYLVEPLTKGLTSEAVLGEINKTIMESSEWEKFDFDLSIGDETEEASEAFSG